LGEAEDAADGMLQNAVHVRRSAGGSLGLEMPRPAEVVAIKAHSDASHASSLGALLGRVRFEAPYPADAAHFVFGAAAAYGAAVGWGQAGERAVSFAHTAGEAQPHPELERVLAWSDAAFTLGDTEKRKRQLAKRKAKREGGAGAGMGGGAGDWRTKALQRAAKENKAKQQQSQNKKQTQ
jgi:hypothetical protein